MNRRLPPECTRMLYVKNLPFSITASEMYDLFGKFGAIRQIRLGTEQGKTKGTAYVVYEDIYDAKAACDHLSGFNVKNRYLILLYHSPEKQKKAATAEERLEELRKLREQHGLVRDDDEDEEMGGAQ